MNGPGRPARTDRLRPARARRIELRREPVVCQLCEQPSAEPVCRRCTPVLLAEGRR